MFMKKQAAGFFVSLIAAIFSAASIIFYLVNSKTAYFVNAGIDSVFLFCAIAGIVLIACLVLLSQRGDNVVTTLLHVAVGVLLAVAFMRFLGVRIGGIAGIMTFENNANTLADLQSALIGIVCAAIAMLFGIIASFLKMTKD